MKPIRPFISGSHPEDRLVFKLARFPRDASVSAPMDLRTENTEARELLYRSVLSNQIPIVFADDIMDWSASKCIYGHDDPPPRPPFKQFVVDWNGRSAGQTTCLVRHITDPSVVASSADPSWIGVHSLIDIRFWTQPLNHRHAIYGGPTVLPLLENSHIIRCPVKGWCFKFEHGWPHKTPMELSADLEAPPFSADYLIASEASGKVIAAVLKVCALMTQVRNVITQETRVRPSTRLPTSANRVPWITCTLIRCLHRGQVRKIWDPECSGGGGDRALHRVRGHYKRYGGEEYGRLFGRPTPEGRWIWVPDHLRGNPERGMRLPNYEVAG